MKCEYKEYCDGEGKAKHQCRDCGILFCDMCTECMQYQCDCTDENIEPLDLKKYRKCKKEGRK